LSVAVHISACFSTGRAPFCLSLSTDVCHNPRRFVGPNVGRIEWGG
jgi:hypothetical protein